MTEITAIYHRDTEAQGEKSKSHPFNLNHHLSECSGCHPLSVVALFVGAFLCASVPVWLNCSLLK